MSGGETLPERVRRLLAAEGAAAEEVRLMGGLSFMTRGHMCCSVGRKGLLVRVGAAAQAAALAEPGVRPMEFAGGRRPAGFVLVDPDEVAADSALAAWLRRGLAFVATLPARPPRTARRR